MNTIASWASDCTHKSAMEALCVDSWYNSAWDGDMLKKKQAHKVRSQVIKGSNPSIGLAKKEEELAVSGHVGKARLTSGVQMGTSKGQRLPQGSGWEMLCIEEALSILDQMVELPSIEKLICILQKCRKAKKLAYAKRVHAYICNNGLESHRVVGNYIVPMFVECGSLYDAQQVFNRLKYRNVHSWTSLIQGYIECGQSEHAFNLYQKMQDDSVDPNGYTLMALVKACARLKDVERGQQIHAEITQKGFESNIFVGNTLVDMYTKCGSMSEAQETFDKLPVRDVVSWTALIAGYAEHGLGQEALKCFEHMQVEGISPNAVTFGCVLKACGNMGAIHKGREIHTNIAQKGFESNVFVSCSLVDMYAKCGSLAEARKVHDNLPVRNVVSWTALIAGYTEHGPGQEALECFEHMQLEAISPDAITFVFVLKACCNIGAIDKGREIHFDITRKGFERDRFVGNTLVDMYAKCGSLGEAREVFDNLPIQDVVSWTALIGGYAEHGPGQEALKAFEHMQLQGISPNAVTFVCVLKACANTGAIHKGREIHAAIAQKGFETELSVGNTLVDMYAKCGSLLEAREVFDKLPVRDVVSWSVMIQGYGMNHDGNMAVQCFKDMQEQGVKPDEITFTCLLTACSRANRVCKGHEFFNMMRAVYGIVPTIDHYTCMVDLLAQSGHLYEAENFLESMPCAPSEETWRALLSACKNYGEAEIGLRCFQVLVNMNPEYAAPYVLMANIYADAGRWDDAYRIEEQRKGAGAKKKPASAFIEVDKKVHEFQVGDDQSEDISGKLQVLNACLQEEGHVPRVNLVVKSIFDEEKEAALSEHAEKLAIAFGLLHTPQGQALRVAKNLRMCNDCHNTSRIISRIERREIIVRDSYQVHHFKEGLCSCGDVG